MGKNKSNVFNTPKGTELPLLNLKGKDYLQVAHRLVWFREERPDWSIETELKDYSPEGCIAKATIRNDKGTVVATAHKTETPQGFSDFIEKAETGAIGRALALVGYGTQFCADELDEGDRLADAPTYPANRGSRDDQADDRSARSSSNSTLTSSAVDLGEYRVNFGKKYYGKKLKEIDPKDLVAYVKWLDESSAKQGKEPSYGVKLLKSAIERYLNPEQYQAPVDADSGSEPSEAAPDAQEGDFANHKAAPPKAVITPPSDAQKLRVALGERVNQHRARLGWNAGDLAQFIQDNYGKAGQSLTNDELETLAETLERMNPTEEAGA